MFVERGIINNSFLFLMGGRVGGGKRVRGAGLMRVNALKLISCLDFFSSVYISFSNSRSLDKQGLIIRALIE